MANKYIDINASGADDGSSWTDAFDNMASIKTQWDTNAVAGDIHFVKGGTYTLLASIISVLDGTNANPITVIGVKSTTTNEPPVLSDWAYGTDRPNFVCGANSFSFDNYWHFSNIRGTITTVGGFGADTDSKAYNCSFVNNSGEAGRIGIDFDAMISCTSESTNGRAFNMVVDGRLIQSYAKDSALGVDGTASCQLFGNIIYNCTEAVEITNICTLVQNSLDTGTSGIVIPSGNTSAPYVFNNSISNFTNGVKADLSGTPILSGFWDYNNWYNNTRDISVDNGTSEDNSMKGLNALAVDPNFTNASSDDFTLAIGSALRKAGMPLLVGVG